MEFIDIDIRIEMRTLDLIANLTNHGRVRLFRWVTISTLFMFQCKENYVMLRDFTILDLFDGSVMVTEGVVGVLDTHLDSRREEILLNNIDWWVLDEELVFLSSSSFWAFFSLDC